MNFLPLAHHIALTILHFIGQIFISWLALTLPATAQITGQADLSLYQIQQLDQSAVLPFWKESTSSFWSYLSESLEENTAENEEDREDGNAATYQQFLRGAAAQHATAKRNNGTFLHAHVPLYLRYCSLKIDLV